MSWIDGNLRIIAYQTSLGERAFEAPEVTRSYGFNVDQLCHIMQLHQTGLVTLMDEEANGADLDRYLELTRERGTRVILYLNAHCGHPELIDANPSFAQRHPDGAPVAAYRTSVMTCVNSPWRDVFMANVESCMKHDIDGIFLDGPIFWSNGCYCEACRTLFQEKYGHDIGRATHRECIAFRTESITRFVRDVREVMLKSTDQPVLYCNNTGLSPNVTGCDVDALLPYVDLIGTEGGFMFYTDPNRTSIWKLIQNANYLTSKDTGKPCVIFCAGNHTPWKCSMHTPAETRLMFAATAAYGANVWYGTHGDMGTLDTPGGRAALEVNLYHEGIADKLADMSRVRRVALVWSKDTVNAFPENIEKTDFTPELRRAQDSDRGSFPQEFAGFHDLLNRLHIQHAIIDEANIRAGQLAEFDLVILPNVYCMSRDVGAAIAAFVAGGGRALATMATSFFGPEGERYDSPLLSGLMGIDSVGEVHDAPAGCAYMRPGDELRAAAGLEARIAGCSKVISNTYEAGRQVMADTYYPMPGGYAPFETRSFPVLVRSDSGAGEFLYMGANVGESLTQYGNQELRGVLSYLLTRNLDRDIRVENAYESMIVELHRHRETGGMLVHFVNYTGHMQRPISSVIECRDIGVAIRCGCAPSAVRATRAQVDLPFSWDGGLVRFTVPRVAEFEVVSVEP